jgi:hypothetical protein
VSCWHGENEVSWWCGSIQLVTWHGDVIAYIWWHDMMTWIHIVTTRAATIHVESSNSLDSFLFIIRRLKLISWFVFHRHRPRRFAPFFKTSMNYVDVGWPHRQSTKNIDISYFWTGLNSFDVNGSLVFFLISYWVQNLGYFNSSLFSLIPIVSLTLLKPYILISFLTYFFFSLFMKIWEFLLEFS